MPELMRLILTRHEPIRGVPEHLKSALGAAASMLMIGALAEVTGLPLLVAPLGATAVILFGYPGSALAQPINIFGSYFVATIIGVAVALFFGDVWWASAGAVGLTLFLMQTLRITHPPAGAIPVLASAMHEDSTRLFITLLVGCVGILVMAIIVHRLPPRRRYPAPKPGIPVQTPVLEESRMSEPAAVDRP